MRCQALARGLFLGLMLLVVSGIFTSAEAQFGNGYSHRREVNFVDAQVAGEPHTNFPVVISETLVDLRTVVNGGKVQNLNGYDIIFTSDQGGATQLAREIERYVDTSGEIVDAAGQIGTGQDFDGTGDHSEFVLRTAGNGRDAELRRQALEAIRKPAGQKHDPVVVAALSRLLDVR